MTTKTFILSNDQSMTRDSSFLSSNGLSLHLFHMPFKLMVLVGWYDHFLSSPSRRLRQKSWLRKSCLTSHFPPKLSAHHWINLSSFCKWCCICICLCFTVFVCICFALYFKMHQNCPMWLRGFFMEITPICRHLLLWRRRVEGFWQKWRFHSAAEYSTGPREYLSFPLYLILTAQKDYSFPDGLLNTSDVCQVL